MLSKFSSPMVSSIRLAANLLTGFARRRFQAQAAIEQCHASPRQTETRFGFNRQTLMRGLAELELNKPIRSAVERRGRPRVETSDPIFADVTDKLLSACSQADRKFQTTVAYARMTGERLRQALAGLLQLPVARTNRRLMNRRGLSLKKVRKTIPL